VRVAGSVLVYVCDECQMIDTNGYRGLLSAPFISEIMWPGKGLSHEFSYHVSQIKVYWIIYSTNVCTTDTDPRKTTVLCLLQCVSAELRHLQ